MTAEQILADIKSDRVKKVIHDGDFSAEIDDQYALAYCLGSEKIDLLAVNAAAYYEEPTATDTEEIMLKSYDEILRVLGELGMNDGSVPALEGARTRVSANENFAPSDSPAARKIIEIAKKSDEPVYVIVTGPCTNVVSACLIDPSIMDKICVIWLGGNCIEEENKPFHEWNLYADYAASQLLLNMDIPLIMLPCDPFGSVKIVADHTDFENITGDTPGAELFRKTLPLQLTTEEKYNTTWYKIMCDLAGPAALSIPDSMEFSIIPAPLMGDDHKYAIDSTRRKIVYGVNPNSEAIVADAMRAINKLVNKD